MRVIGVCEQAVIYTKTGVCTQFGAYRTRVVVRAAGANRAKTWRQRFRVVEKQKRAFASFGRELASFR